MFQYAVARKLAAKGDGIVLADLYFLGLQMQPARKYRLDKFRVQAPRVPWHHVIRYNPGEFLTRLARRSLSAPRAKSLLYRFERFGFKSSCDYRFYHYKPDQPLPPLQIGSTVSERHFHYDPEFQNLSGNLLLMGYWLSFIMLEINFIPLYVGQPAFFELDAFLNKRGYALVELYEKIWIENRLAWCNGLYQKI